jgi:hypothetical protein
MDRLSATLGSFTQLEERAEHTVWNLADKIHRSSFKNHPHYEDAKYLIRDLIHRPPNP